MPPTTSQIIEEGEYLRPDFDPTKLTVPLLTGILTYHQIEYSSSQRKKAELVKIFNEKIKKNGAVLLVERQQRQDTLASEEGIVNGLTGSPVQKPTVRRSSRRQSRDPSAELAHIEPVKRRRASAEPRLGRTKKAAPKHVEVISEESEEELPQVKVEEEPPKKMAKKRESVAAGPSRRISQKFGPGTEESGWEDYNVFQSGAESSSPVRSPVKKAPRKSNLRRRSSFSAPPELPVSPSKTSFTPPHFDFSPELPSFEAKPPRPRLSFVKREPLDDYYDDDSGLADVSAAIVVEEDDYDVEEDSDQQQSFLPHDMQGGAEGDEVEDDEDLGDPQTVAVSQRIAEGGQLVRKHSVSGPPVPLWQKIIICLLVLAVSALSAVYKLESAPIGYCDTGSQTNEVVSEIRRRREQVESCYAEHVEDVKRDLCPPLLLIPLPHPQTCTPCPAHASCTHFSVHCDDGYILSPHPLSRIPYLSELANGLPGLGPIAFPPRCVDDELRKKHIGRLGKAIDSTLAETRGDRICAGIDLEKHIDGGDARKWGYEYEDLKSSLYNKEHNREDGRLHAGFDALFQEAIDQLKRYGRIIEGTDSSGTKYIASDHAEMTWSCKALVAARHSWAEWRRKVFGAIGLFLLALYGRAKFAARRVDKQRVAELVQIVLEELREQELRHHTDPVTTPHPYISSVQLRDLILQDEHNPQVRCRLWDPVEHIIEGNTNVRTTWEELRGGDEGRVWTWVGNTGLASPSKKRVSLPFQSPSRG